MTTPTAENDVQRALEHGHRIDITTHGQKTGQERRIEIMFHNIGGRIVITGQPGWPRAWLANLKADPHFTFHLKGQVVADLPAQARLIADPQERRTVLEPIARLWKIDLDAMVASSPLVEVTFPNSDQVVEHRQNEASAKRGRAGSLPTPREGRLVPLEGTEA